MDISISDVVQSIIKISFIAGLILVLVGLIQMILNKFKSKRYLFHKKLIVGTIVLIISIALYYAYSQVSPNGLLSTPSPKTISTYYGFRIPAKLSDGAVEDSLENNTPITISDNKACIQIENMAEADGWKIKKTDKYFDGGSIATTYFRSNSEPSVSVTCHWSLSEGEYSSVSLKFIP